MVNLTEYYNTRRQLLVNLIGGGGALIGIVVSSSLMKFYTDIVGLSPGLYGIIFLIFSIWNGLNDIFIAYYADRLPFHKTKGKYGRYIRWSIPLIAVSVILLFYISPELPDLIISIYLMVLLLIYEGFKTLMDISFGSFVVNTFLSSHNRSKMGALRNVIQMIPTFIGGMVPVWFLTGDFSRMTVVYVFTGIIAFGILLIYIGSLYIKEDPEFYKNMQTAKGPREILQLFLELLSDKAFVIYIISFFLINVGTGNYFIGYMYYMDNVLLVDGLKATLPDILVGVVQMLSFPLIVIAVKKYGAKWTYIVGMMLAVIGHMLLTLPSGYYFVVFYYVLILGGYGFASVILGTFGGLMTDHIELKTGKRQPAVIGGLMAIFLIPAASFQPLILSYLLEVTNYVGDVKEQTAEVVRAIRWGTGAIPGVLLLIGLLLLMKIPFGRKREIEIQMLIEEKHGKHDSENEVDEFDTLSNVPNRHNDLPDTFNDDY